MGVEITVILQIDSVYAALRTPAPLQSLLNITVLGAVGLEFAKLWSPGPITMSLNEPKPFSLP